MIEMIGVLCLLAAMIGAAKRAPIWTQTTFTDGAHKGAMDWLSNGTEMTPNEIEIGLVKDLAADGYDMPDFLKDKLNLMIIILRDSADALRRPLLVHQRTAFRTLMGWLSEVEGNASYSNKIDVLTTDEMWRLKFTRGKGKFSPYIVKIDKLESDD